MLTLASSTRSAPHSCESHRAVWAKNEAHVAQEKVAFSRCKSYAFRVDRNALMHPARGDHAVPVRRLVVNFNASFTTDGVSAFKCPMGRPEAFLWDATTRGLDLWVPLVGRHAFIFRGIYQGRDRGGDHRIAGHLVHP